VPRISKGVGIVCCAAPGEATASVTKKLSIVAKTVDVVNAAVINNDLSAGVIDISYYNRGIGSIFDKVKGGGDIWEEG